MNADDNVVKMPDRRRRPHELLECPECHVTSELELRCSCGVEYVYVSAGKRAAEAVAANPQKSDRAIAEEIGVGNATVSRVRREATVSNDTVEKRVGLDGKARAMPSKLDRAREIVRPIIEGGGGISRTREALDSGVSSSTVRIARERELGRKEILDELRIDPGDLSPTAQQKLEIAKRQAEQEVKITLANRMREIDEEVRQRVLKEGKEYLDRLNAWEAKAYQTEKLYRELTNNNHAIFSSEEFKIILMALHPDNSASSETRAHAFRLVNAKKLQLTKAR